MELKAGYQKTEVGVIPADWDVQPLSAVSSMKSGENITGSRIDEYSPYPCYGGNGLRGFTTQYTHDGEFALIGRQGALCGNVVGVSGKFFASEHAVVVAPRPGTNIRFLTYLLGQLPLNRLSEASAQPGLSVTKILQLRIGTPRLETEQRAIAEALGDVDALLGSLDRLIAKKRDLKQAAMQQLLTGQTRLPGFTGEWEIKRIGDEIADLIAGVSVNSLVGEIDSGSKGILKTSSVADGVFRAAEAKVIAPRDLHRVRLIPLADTVLISRMNTIDLVGECGYVPADYPTLFIPDRLWMTRFRPNAQLSAKWLSLALSTPASRSLLRNIATGTSGSMKNISKATFLDLKFRMPALAEQSAIAAVLTDIETELAALEQRREKTRALKQGMMQELLTGRTRLV